MSLLQPVDPADRRARPPEQDGPATDRLEDAEQVRALASVERLEIVDVLDHAGACSVAEVAGHLGRASAPLYHHVRVLHRAGIIRKVSGRRPPGRQGTLYELTDPRFARSVRGARRSGRSSRAIGATLRTAEREFREAVQHEVTTGVPVPSLRTMRHTARVTPDVLVEVDRRLDEIASLLQRAHDPQGPGEVYAWTTVIAPTVGRRPRS